jgi:hypothetical protein
VPFPRFRIRTQMIAATVVAIVLGLHKWVNGMNDGDDDTLPIVGEVIFWFVVGIPIALVLLTRAFLADFRRFRLERQRAPRIDWTNP